MFEIPVLLAYFGPETLMPVTSVVATVVGVFLMVGRTGWRWIFRRAKLGFGPAQHAGSRGHHFAHRRRQPEPNAVAAQPSERESSVDSAPTSGQ
ncbi:MAG: hypothetical protein P4L84_19435 [Isosphaeraceae bacterium]|nr:hypothetical protein [Isosphaeraceae bacterium]